MHPRYCSGRLNRDVPEEKLDLAEFAPGHMTESGGYDRNDLAKDSYRGAATTSNTYPPPVLFA